MKCCLCENNELSLLKACNFKDILSSNDFAITDDRFGLTHDVYQCDRCNLVQCPKVPNVELFYKDLVDDNYLLSTPQRKLQIKEIIRYITKFKSKGKLLDVGAGTGILVEAAQSFFKSEGIEPSKWMCEIAEKKNIKIHNHLINEHDSKLKYDVITLIDVIEHVNNPVSILKEIDKRLKDDGIGVLVTSVFRSLSRGSKRVV